MITNKDREEAQIIEGIVSLVAFLNRPEDEIPTIDDALDIAAERISRIRKEARIGALKEAKEKILTAVGNLKPSERSCWTLLEEAIQNAINEGGSGWVDASKYKPKPFEKCVVAFNGDGRDFYGAMYLQTTKGGRYIPLYDQITTYCDVDSTTIGRHSIVLGDFENQPDWVHPIEMPQTEKELCHEDSSSMD
jgi:hypothetical protein